LFRSILIIFRESLNISIRRTGIKTGNGLLNTLKFVNNMSTYYYKIRCNGAELSREMWRL